MPNELQERRKPNKIALQWVERVQHWMAIAYRQASQRAGRTQIDSARRSMLKMPLVTAIVLWLPKSLAAVDAPARPNAVPAAAARDTEDLLKRQFRLQPPASGYYGDGVTDTTAPVQAVLDRLAASSGGDVYFPRGDYPLNIKISGSRIRIFCERGTILRPTNSHPVIDISKKADRIEISGPHITGQTKAQEHKTTAPNVKALHCIRISGTNVVVRNFSTNAARQDGVYINHVADMEPTNLTLENFDINSTSRNPVTIIAARNTIFNRGRIRLDSHYAGNADVNDGYVLFDLEPNNVKEKTRGIQFKNVTFINATQKSGAQAIMLGQTHNGTNIYDIDFMDSRFQSENGATAPAIRLRPDQKHVTKINILNLVADGRIFINTTRDGIVAIENSRFENITLNNSNFSYLVKIGAGCILKGIKSRTGKLNIAGSTNAARVQDVMNMRNRPI